MSLCSCTDMDPEGLLPQSGGIIIATNGEPVSATRSCVDGDVDAATGVLGLCWTAGDELGVFASSGSQVRYTKSNSDKERKAAFMPQGDAVAPKYAYYPHSADNDGLDMTSLKGNVPGDQEMDSGLVHGDYKVGQATGVSAEGYGFLFLHLFSLMRVEVDASGTALEGESLRSVELSLSRAGQPVAITGDFNFNVRTAAVAMGNFTSGTLSMTWNATTPALNSPVVGFVSMFPNVRTGDVMNVTVTTDRHVARFSCPAKVNFEVQGLYNFPVRLSARNPEISDAQGGDPDVKGGTFTCATYNVDGLPSLINSDGPGSSGTTTLGQRINSDNIWDFFCVSEDFEYDSQLTAALSGYSHGTYRGSVGLAQLSKQADTDGLNMFWKDNTGIRVSNETFVEYNDKKGNLYNGANECIRKGFRYYLVTLPDGTEIDVYITHMNTFSGSDISESNAYVAAVHSQLKQVRDYILANMERNRRPAIFMGDTNMRYTRHKLKEYFIDPINAMPGYSVVDPWVSLAWNYDFSSVGGTTYPLYGGKSLMVSDATGTDASTDVIISEADGGLQKGEIVDKVIYINCEGFDTQLTARSYLRDVSYKKSNGSPLADHYPVVVEFGYTTK